MKSKTKTSSITDTPRTNIPAHIHTDRRVLPAIHVRQWLGLMLILASIASASAGDYVLVVDTSGSMKEQVSRKDNRVRIAVVQKALRE
jgi:Mg-chelatase subunit ChlD